MLIFAKLLKHKSIHVNGKIIKKVSRLSKGDILELFIEDLFYDLILDPDVIYEDENMIIFNKPSGMSCEYPEDPEERTVLSIAETMMRQSDEYNPDILTVPYLCTPHARQIGGLTVVAKDEKYLSRFQRGDKAAANPPLLYRAYRWNSSQASKESSIAIS